MLFLLLMCQCGEAANYNKCATEDTRAECKCDRESGYAVTCSELPVLKKKLGLYSLMTITRSDLCQDKVKFMDRVMNIK